MMHSFFAIYFWFNQGRKICYARFPVTELLERGADPPPMWFNLQEDKAINALPDDEFPGSLQIK